MTSVVRTLTEGEIEQSRAQATAIANAAQDVVQDVRFVFFAAFDGTNNDRERLAISGDPQMSNAAQLEELVGSANRGNVDVSARYFPGVGTGGTSLPGSTWMEAAVTQQVINVALEAYTRFRQDAINWLADHPDGSITAMVTGFSRGCASAAIFSQLLYEGGLVDFNGDVLVPPGKIGVAAGVLFDPVATGVDGNLAFAPNATNIVAIQASDEFRYSFKATDYSVQSEIVSTYTFLGNHGDVGGTYDNGLGALTLEAATEFFQGTGLSIADVGVGRQFGLGQSVNIHTEGFVLSPSGSPITIWSEYDPSNGRLTSNAPKPAVVQSDGDGGTVTTFTDALGRPVIYTQSTLDGTVTEVMTIRDAVTANVLAETTVHISEGKIVTSVSLDVDGDGSYESTHSVTKTAEGEVDELTLFDIDGAPQQETYAAELAEGSTTLPEELLSVILDHLPSALATTAASSDIQFASASTIMLTIGIVGSEGIQSESTTLTFADGDQITIQGSTDSNGNSSGVIIRSDGTHGVYTDNDLGETYVGFYTAEDELLNDRWTWEYGGFGESHYDSEGSYHMNWINADGGIGAIVRHGDGFGSDRYYWPDGTYITSYKNLDGSWGQSFRYPSGEYGSDNFDANGFGRHEWFSDDGVAYDVWETAPDGSAENHEQAHEGDGVRQYDRFDAADGSYDETLAYSDGRLSTSAYNASTGESTSTVLHANGDFRTSHRWVRSDGATETKNVWMEDGEWSFTDEVIFADGSITGVSVQAKFGDEPYVQFSWLRDDPGALLYQTLQSYGLFDSMSWSSKDSNPDGSFLLVTAGFSQGDHATSYSNSPYSGPGSFVETHNNEWNSELILDSSTGSFSGQLSFSDGTSESVFYDAATHHLTVAFDITISGVAYSLDTFV